MEDGFLSLQWRKYAERLMPVILFRSDSRANAALNRDLPPQVLSRFEMVPRMSRSIVRLLQYTFPDCTPRGTLTSRIKNSQPGRILLYLRAFIASHRRWTKWRTRSSCNRGHDRR